MSFFPDILGALEHHVLEEVSEASQPRPLVGRPHVIPDVDRNQGQPVILVEDHLQAVRQPVSVVSNLRNRRTFLLHIPSLSAPFNPGHPPSERGGLDSSRTPPLSA